MYGENGAAVDSVMIDGRFVMREGKLLTVDEAKLRRDAQRACDRLVEANAGARSAHARSKTSWAYSASGSPTRRMGCIACCTKMDIAECADQTDLWLRGPANESI